MDSFIYVIDIRIYFCIKQEGICFFFIFVQEENMMFRVFVVDLRYQLQLLSCFFEVLEGVVNREVFIYYGTFNYEVFIVVCILSYEGFVDVLMKIID